MTSPASYLPARTAGMISANGTTSMAAGSCALVHRRNSRYAVDRSLGHRYPATAQLDRSVATREHEWTAAAADRPAARQERVTIHEPWQRGI